MSNEYERERNSIIQGFNTWDTRSLTCHVKMPEAFAFNIGLKEYLKGRYLKEPLIGRSGSDPETVLAGNHSYNGSYTSLDIFWRKIKLRIETAHADNDIVVRIRILENHTRFIPVCIVEGAVLWNFDGYSRREGNRLYWCNCNQDEMVLYIVKGHIHEDPSVATQAGYLPISLSESIYLSSGRMRTPGEVDEHIKHQDELFQKQKQAYGEYADAWEAMQTCLAWNEIYEPQYKRILTNVSRLWNIDRGGFGMFCWDNFFASLMISLDDPERARANAIEILNEQTDSGFVPNCSNGNGRKSFDRSQPPVGSMAIREIYRRDPQVWFLQETFPKLLKWNEWWFTHRKNGLLLSWGSNEYDNCWEMGGINQLEGSALESGLDNSPMYDENEITFDPAISMQQLWDVGLNGLYANDCHVLADIAGVLGEEQIWEKLLERYEAIRKNMALLWDEENGFYYNYKTDRKCFSRRISPCNFYALLACIPNQEQFDTIMNRHFYNKKEFWGNWILPSIARNDPAYADNDYWRGRIWAPLNFLVYIGMLNYPRCQARLDLVDKSAELLLQEWCLHRHIHENYNAETGIGDNVDSSDRFYQWGGLLGLIGLIEAGYMRDFGQPLFIKGIS